MFTSPVPAARAAVATGAWVESKHDMYLIHATWKCGSLALFLPIRRRIPFFEEKLKISNFASQLSDRFRECCCLYVCIVLSARNDPCADVPQYWYDLKYNIYSEYLLYYSCICILVFSSNLKQFTCSPGSLPLPPETWNAFQTTVQVYPHTPVRHHARRECRLLPQ